MKRKKFIPYSLPDAEYLQAKAARILETTITTDRGCMEWQGWRNRKGYGEIGMKDSSNARCHRVVYKAVRGEVPADWDVCHTCDNPPCVNPLHLFAAPRSVNVQDMRAKKRGNHQKQTACKWGHDFTPENTYVDSRNFRQCRTCIKGWQRKKYQKKRAESSHTSTPEHT